MSSASISKRSSRRPIRDWPAWREENFCFSAGTSNIWEARVRPGLDLDVYHLASDSVRDVRTLSGGESFMASLAMALGLSDIVQNTAGAVSIDTMFVDEGFGALDDEAREQAVRVLADLAGEQRLVGIISHVNELKEQIDRKLVVKKTETGSTVHWEW